MRVTRGKVDHSGEGRWLMPLIIGLAVLFTAALALSFTGYRQVFFARLGPPTEIKAFVILEDGALAPFSSDRLSSALGLVFKLETARRDSLILLSQVDDGEVKLEWSGDADPSANGQVVSANGLPLIFRFADAWKELTLCVLPQNVLAPKVLPRKDSLGEGKVDLQCFTYERQNLRNVFP